MLSHLSWWGFLTSVTLVCTVHYLSCPARFVHGSLEELRVWNTCLRFSSNRNCKPWTKWSSAPWNRCQTLFFFPPSLIGCRCVLHLKNFLYWFISSIASVQVCIQTDLVILWMLGILSWFVFFSFLLFLFCFSDKSCCSPNNNTKISQEDRQCSAFNELLRAFVSNGKWDGLWQELPCSKKGITFLLGQNVIRFLLARCWVLQRRKHDRLCANFYVE